jgi:hypothetical protein
MSRADYEHIRARLWDLACGEHRLGRERMAIEARGAYYRFTVYAVVNS